MKKVIILIPFMAMAGLMAQTEKIRVFISDSSSWEIAGGGAGGIGHGDSIGIFNGGGGARPQTNEIIKTFQERCPSLTVTNNKEKADFLVSLDHEGGKGFLRDNKVAVYDKEGDVIYSGATRMLGNAVKDACTAILNYRPEPVKSQGISK